MNAASKRRNGADALLLWLAALAVSCAGFYAAFVALAGAIDVQHERTARVADAIRADAEIAAQRPVLEREQRIVDQRVRDLGLQADRAALVARFVQTAARIADEQAVSLDRVEARAAAPVSPASGSAAQSPGGVSFESIPLEVSLSGRYNALLAAIRELALTPLPMRIEIAAIERGAAPDSAAAAAPLTARLHLVLQHLSDTPAAPAPHSLP